jgi:ABC-type polysaccharide/polyol phosphate transport system ATPase subunit
MCPLGFPLKRSVRRVRLAVASFALRTRARSRGSTPEVCDLFWDDPPSITKTVALPIPLLTGRENIVLRGLHRGLTEQDGRAMADEIAEFSGLGEFIDLPIRAYSAGMNMRLAFARGTAITPEILLMDEWFLAGDANSMAKAEDRLPRLVTGADILVIATHDMGVVR